MPELHWDIRRPGWKLMPYAVEIVLDVIRRNSSPLVSRVIDDKTDLCIFSQPDGSYRVIVL